MFVLFGVIALTVKEKGVFPHGSHCTLALPHSTAMSSSRPRGTEELRLKDTFIRTTEIIAEHSSMLVMGLDFGIVKEFEARSALTS